MQFDIYNLSGRHLNSEEICYVVEERCKDIGVKFLRVEGVLIHNNEYCVEIHQGNATLYLNSKEISRAKCI